MVLIVWSMALRSVVSRMIDFLDIFILIVVIIGRFLCNSVTAYIINILSWRCLSLVVIFQLDLSSSLWARVFICVLIFISISLLLPLPIHINPQLFNCVSPSTLFTFQKLLVVQKHWISDKLILLPVRIFQSWGLSFCNFPFKRKNRLQMRI